MKIALALLAFLCIVIAVLQIYTLPTEFWWPASMISRELWPLLVVANAAGVCLPQLLAAALGGVHWLSRGFAVASDAGLARRSRDAAAMEQTGVRGAGAAITGARRSISLVIRRPAQASRRARGAAAQYPPVSRFEATGAWTTPYSGEHSWRFVATRQSRRGRNVHQLLRAQGMGRLLARLSPRATMEPPGADRRRAGCTQLDRRPVGAEYGADTSRISLAGRSAGGHLALLAAYASERFPIRSVVSYSAPSDLAGAYADPPVPDPLRVRERMEIFLGSTPRDSPKVYRNASPITYLRPQLPPTLQIHGVHDCIVKIRFARSLHGGLLSQGNRSLLLEIPWSDHAFDFVYFGAGNALALPYVEAFLNATVGERP